MTAAENFARPISSCGATCRKNAASPSLACWSLSSSDIEPELSSTSSTLAGLRSRRQVSSTLLSTCGVGSVSVRRGWAGSAPLAAVTSPAGVAVESPGRKPSLPATSGVTLSARNFWNAAAAAFFSGVTQSALSTMYGESEMKEPSVG